MAFLCLCLREPDKLTNISAYESQLYPALPPKFRLDEQADDDSNRKAYCNPFTSMRYQLPAAGLTDV